MQLNGCSPIPIDNQIGKLGSVAQIHCGIRICIKENPEQYRSFGVAQRVSDMSVYRPVGISALFAGA
ncbi:hypothetical protein D3C76_1685030 [compost metagenome]